MELQSVFSKGFGMVQKKQIGYLCSFLVVFLFSMSVEAQQNCKKDDDCSNGYRCIKNICTYGIKLSKVQLVDYKLAIAPVVLLSKHSSLPSFAQKTEAFLRQNFRILVGTIQVLSSKGFLEQAPHNGIELGTFLFDSWKRIGSNGLLKMAMDSKDGKKLELRVRFYDIDLSRLLFRADWEFDVSELANKMNTLSNILYKKLTGKKGFFHSQVAYVKRNFKGGKDIWLMNANGKNHRILVGNGSINILPRWSPDGKYIFFTSYLTRRPLLYKVHVQSRKVSLLIKTSGTYTGATLSPDGKTLVFSLTPAKSDNAEIYSFSGKKMRPLTQSWGIDTSPSWSPDGKQIAFVSERFASPQIFLMNADGSGQTRLTFRGDYNQEPVWSPTGKEIMFTARDEKFQYDLFVIRMDKEKNGELKLNYRRLTQGQGKNLEACWSPDGKYVLFVSTRFGEKKLFIMNADGSKQRLLFRGRGDYETPAWAPF